MKAERALEEAFKEADQTEEEVEHGMAEESKGYADVDRCGEQEERCREESDGALDRGFLLQLDNDINGRARLEAETELVVDEAMEEAIDAVDNSVEIERDEQPVAAEEDSPGNGDQEPSTMDKDKPSEAEAFELKQKDAPAEDAGEGPVHIADQL